MKCRKQITLWLLFVVVFYIGLTPVATARSPAACPDPAKLLDMTFVFDADTIYWPTAEPFKLEKLNWKVLESGWWYASNNYGASEHGGTHADAPIHFAGERTLLMFEKRSGENYADPLPGIRRKTLVFGERTLMTEFLLAAGSLLPDHAHPYEQTGYLVRGRMILKIGDKEFDAAAGDSWCIPENVIHGARILEDAMAVEVFSPARADYLPAEINGKLEAS